MKKLIAKIISFSLIISCFFTMTSFSATNGRPDFAHVPPTDTKLLPPDQTHSESKTQSLQRGSLLAACVLNISNAGGGEIGVLADTMCHVDVDGIYVTIYLDQYNEETEKWTNREVYVYEFTPADTEDGKLHAKLIDFNVLNQPAGHYYRLWAYHEAEKNGAWETMKTATDGILITKNP